MQPTSFKSSVNYGAINGLICFAMFLLIYWMGFNPLGQASLLAVWVQPLFIWLSVRYYRDELLQGQITFSEGFRAGMLTALGGALLYALLVYSFGKVIDAGLLDNYKEIMLTDLEKTETELRGLFGDKYYDSVFEDIKNKTLTGQAVSDFISKVMGGVVFSIIIALILKRNSPKTI